MEKKAVTVGNPMTIAGITLIPVTEISLHSWQRKRSVSFFGIKQPLGVIVISSSEKKAFRASGEEVPLDELIQEVPAAKELLNTV